MGDGAEHVDVLVVGAGISGIGAAYHLRDQRPDTTFAVLEALGDFGGTWRTHTYPGIRSDSDLYTFGYRFKPWIGPPIATAEEILTYLGEVIDDHDLARHIRYQHRIESAEWSSEDRRWTLHGTRGAAGAEERFTITTSFLWMCQGYYRQYDGYTPDWDGVERFEGTVVHPQTWPDDLVVTDRRVVVIGSGATAATLIPAIAGAAAHVTMLQRSPTYFFTGRNADELADLLREVDTPEEWVHEIVRRRRLLDSARFTERCFTEPEVVKDELLALVRSVLPADYDVDTHFTPRYLPWRQRVAFVPDGDLFAAISAGDASVVTGEIDTFDETGIRLTNGEHVDADVIVTATGFHLNVLGDVAFTIDGEPLAFHETVTYHGAMFTGVPNMAWVFGYFRSSWTLRADLIADFVCRLLGHMAEKGADVVVPRLRPGEEQMELRPWVDPENFNPGYIQRGLHLLPKQGDHPPWQHTQDYWRDKEALPAVDLDDGALAFE